MIVVVANVNVRRRFHIKGRAKIQARTRQTFGQSNLPPRRSSHEQRVRLRIESIVAEIEVELMDLGSSSETTLLGSVAAKKRLFNTSFSQFWWFMANGFASRQDLNYCQVG